MTIICYALTVQFGSTYTKKFDYIFKHFIRASLFLSNKDSSSPKLSSYVDQDLYSPTNVRFPSYLYSDLDVHKATVIKLHSYQEHGSSHLLNVDNGVITGVINFASQDILTAPHMVYFVPVHNPVYGREPVGLARLSAYLDQRTTPYLRLTVRIANFTEPSALLLCRLQDSAHDVTIVPVEETRTTRSGLYTLRVPFEIVKKDSQMLLWALASRKRRKDDLKLIASIGITHEILDKVIRGSIYDMRYFPKQKRFLTVVDHLSGSEISSDNSSNSEDGCDVTISASVIQPPSAEDILMNDRVPIIIDFALDSPGLSLRSSLEKRLLHMLSQSSSHDSAWEDSWSNGQGSYTNDILTQNGITNVEPLLVDQLHDDFCVLLENLISFGIKCSFHTGSDKVQYFDNSSIEGLSANEDMQQTEKIFEAPDPDSNEILDTPVPHLQKYAETRSLKSTARASLASYFKTYISSLGNTDTTHGAKQFFGDIVSRLYREAAGTAVHGIHIACLVIGTDTISCEYLREILTYFPSMLVMLILQRPCSCADGSCGHDTSIGEDLLFLCRYRNCVLIPFPGGQENAQVLAARMVFTAQQFIRCMMCSMAPHPKIKEPRCMCGHHLED